jgi:hypothetical protein
VSDVNISKGWNNEVGHATFQRVEIEAKIGERRTGGKPR